VFSYLVRFLAYVVIYGILGVVQDIDNSILGTYILQNKFNKPESKKTNKIIYRSVIVLILVGLFCYIQQHDIKFASIFLGSYFGTSVISLIIQHIEDERIKSVGEIEKIQTELQKLTN
jgi:hypothetical protein